MSGSLENYIF
uniref:Uncharacterized protein n=1 Tax=Anguilla anguilla TaxID=7936 RepID=A0A0E9RA11_ANGAN